MALGGGFPFGALAFACVSFCASSGAGQSVTTYKYDVLGRLTEAREGDGRTAAYAYDAAGNRVGLSPNSLGLEYTPAGFSASSQRSGFSGLSSLTAMRDLSFNFADSAHVTLADAVAWIEVDLGALKTIDHIDLAAPDRAIWSGAVDALNGAIVELSQDRTTWSPVATVNGATPGIYATIAMGGARARYVRLRKADAEVGVGDFRLFGAPRDVNHAPVALPISRVKLLKDDIFSIDPRTSVSDLDGDALTVTAVSPALHGATRFTATGLTYTPAPGYVGPDDFTYVVADDHGGFVTGTVHLQYNAEPSSGGTTLSAVDDTFSVIMSSPAVLLPVLDNDSAPSGASLTVISTGQAGHGVAFPSADGLALYYTPTVGYLGPDTFSYVISDGKIGRAEANVNVTVWRPNRQPEAVDDHVTAYPGLGATFDPTVNDLDDGALTVTQMTQPSHGVVTRRDTFLYYDPTPGYLGPDSFSYTATDAGGLTTTATVHISVVKYNRNPTAEDDNARTDVNLAKTIPVLANDSDAEGDALSVTGVTQPTHGQVTFNPTTVTYHPAQDYIGPDSFTYTVWDGLDGVSTATVRVTVLPANRLPNAVGETVSTYVNLPVTLAVLTNDSDPDGDDLTLERVTQPGHGAVTTAGATVTYSPAADYAGPDVFTYTIADGRGGLSDATVSIEVVRIANSNPVARNDAPVDVRSGASVTLDVLANDTDADNDPLRISAVGGQAHGDVLIATNGKTVTYTPVADYQGPDGFIYEVVDGKGGRATAAASVNVRPPNRSPQANPDGPITVAFETPTLISVLANDVDPDGDALAVSATTTSVHGAVSLVGGGKIEYTPSAGYSGPDKFVYTASDGHGGTAQSLVSLLVSKQRNRSPVGVDDTYEVAFNASDVPLAVLANDSDPDGDALRIIAFSTPDHGQVATDGLKLYYTSEPGFSGLTTLRYTVSDALGVAEATATITVRAPANLPPVADDATLVISSGTTGSVLVSMSDPDGDPLTITNVSTPAHGAAAKVGADRIAYMPSSGYVGSDSFSYTVSDGKGGAATGRVDVTVLAGTRQPPVAVDDAFDLPAGANSTIIDPTGNDHDPDSGFSVIGVGPAVHGTVTRSGNQITYRPDGAFVGEERLVYTLGDPDGLTANAVIRITSHGRFPVAATDGPYWLQPGASITVQPLANDSDPAGRTLTLADVGAPAHGSVQRVGDAVTYTAQTGYSGSDSVDYLLLNDRALGATGSILFKITSPSNHQPQAKKDLAWTAAGESVTVPVLDNDQDVDGDALSVVGVSTPARGAAVFSAGSVTYTPQSGFQGQDSFAYTVSDGQGGKATGSVIVTVGFAPGNGVVIAASDGPIVARASQTTTIDVLANDTSTDPRPLHVADMTLPQHGSLTREDDVLRYTPNGGYFGPDGFTYLVTNDVVGAVGRVAIVVPRTANRNPQPAADATTIAFGQSKLIAVLANDSDPDGDPLTLSAVTRPANGTSVITGTGITYTPKSGFSGSDLFSYTVSDGQGATATQTVSVTVSPNHRPAAVADGPFVTASATPITIPVLANDTDSDGDALSVTMLTAPRSGVATTNPDGTITYTPASGFSGADSFRYSLTDPWGMNDSATVQVKVEAAGGQPPVARDDGPIWVTSSARVTLTVLDNDSDPNASALNITSVGLAGHGTTTSTATSVSYTPSAGYNGPDSFTYAVTNSQGRSAAATVRLNVATSNKTPTPVADGPLWVQAGRSIIIPVLANDSDPDGDTLTVQAVSSPGQGTAVVNGDGTVTYAAREGAMGADSFTYTVSDGRGRVSGATRVTVYIGS